MYPCKYIVIDLCFIESNRHVTCFIYMWPKHFQLVITGSVIILEGYYEVFNPTTLEVSLLHKSPLQTHCAHPLTYLCILLHPLSLPLPLNPHHLSSAQFTMTKAQIQVLLLTPMIQRS